MYLVDRTFTVAFVVAALQHLNAIVMLNNDLAWSEQTRLAIDLHRQVLERHHARTTALSNPQCFAQPRLLLRLSQKKKKKKKSKFSVYSGELLFVLYQIKRTKETNYFYQSIVHSLRHKLQKKKNQDRYIQREE